MDLVDKLVIAISSRALFNLNDSNAVFERDGVEAYAAYQIAHEEEPLEPGIAFPLVKKLLAINKKKPLIEVILLSRNSADTSLRVFNSIQHYALPIVRAAFSNGASPYPYVNAFGADLFLSANPNDVRRALSEQCAAAMFLPASSSKPADEETLRIAFDGDAVLFADDAERVYQKEGLDAFLEREKTEANTPLPAGPFHGFIKALHSVQKQFSLDDCPIRTALVTARSAPAHERVIRTLRAWGIRIDESLFLGGLDKGEFLKAFRADVFFDDQLAHCESAAKHAAAGHVLNGVMNEEDA